jgi:hypothetical protein
MKISQGRFWEKNLSTNFEGLSGKISFKNSTLSKLPIFEIINVVGKSYKEVAFWSPEFGFSEDFTEHDREKVRVFNGSINGVMGHIMNMPSTHLSWTAGLFCTYGTLLDCLHGNSCVHKKMLLVEDCKSLFVSLLYRFFLLFCLFDLLRLHSFPFPCIAFFPIYACNLFDEMTFRIFLSIPICSIFHSNIFTWYQSTSDFFFSNGFRRSFFFFF